MITSMYDVTHVYALAWDPLSHLCGQSSTWVYLGVTGQIFIVSINLVAQKSFLEVGKLCCEAYKQEFP